MRGKGATAEMKALEGNTTTTLEQRRRLLGTCPAFGLHSAEATAELPAPALSRAPRAGLKLARSALAIEPIATLCLGLLL